MFDVTRFWEEIKDTQTFAEVSHVNPNSPKQEGFTRFVCVSDTHSMARKIGTIPEGDVLLHAGDFSNVGMEKDIVEFNQWLKDQPYAHKVVIAGNHDVTFDVENYDPDLYLRFQKPRGLKQPYNPLAIKGLLKDCIYLEDSSTNVLGFDIYGSPWQPEFYAWGFNLPRCELILEKWKMIPDKVDILITHGPPLGRGDLCYGGHRAGCHYLMDEIQNRIKPKYHIFGHIHEGYGVTSDGTTTYINASTCTFSYAPDNPPIVFDLPNPN